jgi:hypothetical protein
MPLSTDGPKLLEEVTGINTSSTTNDRSPEKIRHPSGRRHSLISRKI